VHADERQREFKMLEYLQEKSGSVFFFMINFANS